MKRLKANSFDITFNNENNLMPDLITSFNKKLNINNEIKNNKKKRIRK